MATVNDPFGPTTRLVHADAPHRPDGAIVPPIEQASTFASASAAEFAEVSAAKRPDEFYTRYGNPNHAQVAAVVADLEGAESALVTASGTAALTTTVLALASAGERIVMQRSQYGGTTALGSRLLPRLGIDVQFVDQTDLEAWRAAITPGTKLVLLETPSNPHLAITDVRAVSAIAREAGALTLVDNTFATPINQRPLELGADLVWHSATKYLAGHSDLLAGVVAGSQELLDQIWKTSLVVGAVAGPIDSWLLLRGLRTLALRVARHNENAAAIAELAATHPAVATVFHPSRPDAPGHEVAKTQMDGFGGVVSIELSSGTEAALRFVDALQLAYRATSLGGVETLVAHIASMWGAESKEHLDALGVTPGLVRIATGIEDTADLVADVQRALDAVG